MSILGDSPEGWLGRLLRYFCYFLFGAVLGLLPAGIAIAATSSQRIVWKVPIFIIAGSGALFCLLGILTKGSYLGWLLRVFGRDIDSWP